MAEAAYDLQLGAEEWLPNLLDKGAPLFDVGLGCAAAMWAGQSRDGQPLIAQLCVGSGAEDLGVRFGFNRGNNWNDNQNFAVVAGGVVPLVRERLGLSRARRAKG